MYDLICAVDAATSGPLEPNGVVLCPCSHDAQGNRVQLVPLVSQGGFGAITEQMKEQARDGPRLTYCSCTLSPVMESDERMHGAAATTFLASPFIRSPIILPGMKADEPSLTLSASVKELRLALSLLKPRTA